MLSAVHLPRLLVVWQSPASALPSHCPCMRFIEIITLFSSFFPFCCRRGIGALIMVVWGYLNKADCQLLSAAVASGLIAVRRGAPGRGDSLLACAPPLSSALCLQSSLHSATFMHLLFPPLPFPVPSSTAGRRHLVHPQRHPGNCRRQPAHLHGLVKEHLGLSAAAIAQLHRCMAPCAVEAASGAGRRASVLLLWTQTDV